MHQVSIIEIVFFFFIYKKKFKLPFSLSFSVREKETFVDRRKKSLVNQNANVNQIIGTEEGVYL